MLLGGGVFLGLMAFMLWPAAPAEAPLKAGAAGAVRRVDPVKPLQALPRTVTAPAGTLPLESTPEGEAKLEVTGPKFEEISLTRRLEDYYLTEVLLENVQLGQAMSILRSKLQETDSERALALHRLAVTTPAAAVGRRVTLFSQSIPYLTAVQNVATQAGCTVEVTENRITLKVQPGPYPQTASKRAMKDLLSGLFDKEGRPLSQSSEALGQLSMLASQLGIQFDAEGNASLTANQWEALRQMQNEQRRQASNALPTFALYLLPAGFLSPNLNPDPVAVFNLLVNLHHSGYPPYSRLPETMDPTVPWQVLMLLRRGEAIVLTLMDIPATENVAEVEEEPVTTSPPQSSASAMQYSGRTVIGDMMTTFGSASYGAYKILRTNGNFSASTSTSAYVVNDLLRSDGVIINIQVLTPPAADPGTSAPTSVTPVPAVTPTVPTE